MFDTQFTDLDAAGAVDHAVACRAAMHQAEAELLATAAHFADLHAILDPAGRPTASDGSGRALPGAERLVRLGGEGTPEVAEFCPAELGAALGVSDSGAAVLIADGLDLRHRLPRLWDRIRAGEVPAWIGRKAAQSTRGSTQQAVAVVDRRIAPFAHRLSWGRLEPIVQAAVMEADPRQAALDAEAAASSVGVFRGRSSDHGIVTTVLRTEAPDAIMFDAAIDRISTGLAMLGDERDTNSRRAASVGILAHPQETLDLHAAVRVATPAAAHAQGTQAVGRSADHPGWTDADAPTTPPDPALDRSGRTAAGRSGIPVLEPTARAQGGRPRGSPRPDAVLYVHLTDQTLARGEGVSRVEGLGPVTASQVRAWLSGARVSVRPVLDLDKMTPVDGYEVPDRMRDALHLLHPADCFPYATAVHRGMDADHTRAYVAGRTGQTRIGNLGKLTRTHHRIRTHGRWQVRQPFPGIWIWRSPQGRHYLVGPDGTTRLGRVTTDRSSSRGAPGGASPGRASPDAAA